MLKVFLKSSKVKVKFIFHAIINIFRSCIYFHVIIYLSFIILGTTYIHLSFIYLIKLLILFMHVSREVRNQICFRSKNHGINLKEQWVSRSISTRLNCLFVCNIGLMFYSTSQFTLVYCTTGLYFKNIGLMFYSTS